MPTWKKWGGDESLHQYIFSIKDEQNAEGDNQKDGGEQKDGGGEKKDGVPAEEGKEKQDESQGGNEKPKDSGRFMIGGALEKAAGFKEPTGELRCNAPHAWEWPDTMAAGSWERRDGENWVA